MPDEKLVGLVAQGKRKYQKREGGDPACAWMNVVYQPEEVYRGLAAGRILVERHGEDYVKDLLKGKRKLGFMYAERGGR